MHRIIDPVTKDDQAWDADKDKKYDSSHCHVFSLK